MKLNTLLLHGKSVDTYTFGSTVPQINQTNAFAYESAEELEEVFAHKKAGYAYSRIGNPTVDAFERRVSELEGGLGAVACSSGMSAVTLALLNILSTGDEIIVSRAMYGGTLSLFKDFKAFGITVHYVPCLDKAHVQPLINTHTKALFGETISNPGLHVLNIREAANIAHTNHIPLIIDNTTASPVLVKPIELGADIVVHSTSKYIDGGGNSIGGMIIDSGHFKWDDRYPVLNEYKKYGPYAYLFRLKTDLWENIGGCLAPFNAFLSTVGLETLGLRMERICDNAKKLYLSLSQRDDITVNYPDNDLVNTQLSGQGGGILTIRLGSKKRAYKVINSLKYARISSNIGDVRTLVIHPESTLFIHNTDKQKEEAGVYDDLIRVSVGIENIEDLIEDFTNALNNTKGD